MPSRHARMPACSCFAPSQNAHARSSAAVVWSSTLERSRALASICSLSAWSVASAPARRVGVFRGEVMLQHEWAAHARGGNDDDDGAKRARRASAAAAATAIAAPCRVIAATPNMRKAPLDPGFINSIEGRADEGTRRSTGREKQS